VSFSLEKGDFLAICGATGSGKSTLLRLLKKELSPLGRQEGEVLFRGQALAELDSAVSACKIGYVMQRPEQQLVTDRVWHELAFGLENMGVPQEEIRRRVAEMACFFGIEDWFERPVNDLSGGQKQLLNLAAVMVMQPEVLILDEPTAQLDPIAATEFINAVSRLNRELSLTVIMVEHRLEEVLAVADRLLVLENGRVLAFGETRETVGKIRENRRLIHAMPAAVRLYSRFEENQEIPLTVREGRGYIEHHFGNEIRTLQDENQPLKSDNALEFREVYFRYSRHLPDVLQGVNFSVKTGEIFCILGGNGSGKSTALGAAAGLNRIYSGKIKVFDRKIQDYAGQSLYKNCLTMLPQDVQTVFLKNTLREEMEELGNAVEESILSELSPHLDRHPYDLSGGQQQLAGLAKVLGTRPRLLLLDEVTKGLDAYARDQVMEVLKALRQKGMTIVAVTHDMEFAAGCADRCAMFFRGTVTSVGSPREFFAGNRFYTTPAVRMTAGYYDNAVTIDDAEALCRANGGGKKK